MINQHPITPPPELVEQWRDQAPEGWGSQIRELHIATQAARWRADQELEASCEYISRWLATPEYRAAELRAARRPKPPSLKEQALEAVQRFYAKGHEDCTNQEVKDDFDIIRRALEALDD